MALKDEDFLFSGIDVDYRREYNCESVGCSNEVICRCSQIIDATIISIDMKYIVNRIYSNIFDNSLASKRNSIIDSILLNTNKEIDIYTIDRIARNCKLYLPSSWDVNISNSYYGEEIESIVIKSEVLQDLESKLEKAFSLELKERIDYLLLLEYGYILPELINRDYKIIKINKSDIIFGSENHLKGVSKKDLKHYSDISYDGIRGIVIEKSGKYKLIDGYHRCFSTNKEKVLVLKAHI